MNTAEEPRYDVILFNVASREIIQLAGEDMLLSEGSFHTAEKRLMTVLERINSSYDAEIVPAGSYKVGDAFIAEAQKAELDREAQP